MVSKVSSASFPPDAPAPVGFLERSGDLSRLCRHLCVQFTTPAGTNSIQFVHEQLLRYMLWTLCGCSNQVRSKLILTAILWQIRVSRTESHALLWEPTPRVCTVPSTHNCGQQLGT